jgi:hypothetical protein
MLTADNLKFDLEAKRAICETKDCSFAKNVDNDAWKMPRMWTLKQVRDTFFTMLIQSHLYDKQDES